MAKSQLMSKKQINWDIFVKFSQYMNFKITRLDMLSVFRIKILGGLVGKKQFSCVMDGCINHRLVFWLLFFVFLLM